MPQHYDETFKTQIVRLRLEEGRSIRSIMEEYGMSKASIINWCNEFREECQNNPESQNEYDSMKEIRKLRKEMEELRKENLFLTQTSHTENIPYALINQLELNVESHSRTLLCTQTTHPKSGQIVQESFQERFDQQDF